MRPSNMWALTPAEQLLVDFASSGEVCNLNATFKTEPERTVRASVLRDLCLQQHGWSVDPRGVRVVGAVLREELNLAHCDLPFPLEFRQCTFGGGVDLTEAKVRGLAMPACRVDGWFKADNVVVAGAVLLCSLNTYRENRLYEQVDPNETDQPFVVSGPLYFANARVEGDEFNCGGGKFKGEGALCLFAQGIEVRGSVLLCEGFTAAGKVNFAGAKVSGQFNCNGATLLLKDDTSLFADGIDVGHNVILSRTFTSMGAVSFAGAKVGEQFNCSGGIFAGEGAWCLFAQGIEVAQDVVLNDGFQAKGAVDFSSAKVGGQFNCSGGKFEGKGDALFAQEIAVTKGVLLNDGFTAHGGVSFAGAKMGGQFNCSGGIFAGEGDGCLFAQGIEVAQDVLLCNGFQAKGAVDFAGAKVGGQFNCSGGKFEGKGDKCLFAQGVEVRESVFLTEDFCAKGTVDFNAAKVGEQFACMEATFARKGKKCLFVQGIEVRGSVFLSRGFFATGTVDFNMAKVAGHFICHKSTFARKGKKCLYARNIRVAHDLRLTGDLTAQGTVDFANAKVGGHFICHKSTFARKGKKCLYARNIEVAQDVLLRKGFTAKGTVDLRGCRIKGSMSVEEVELDEFDLSHGTVEGAFSFDPKQVRGDIDLRDAHIGTWDDKWAVRKDTPLTAWQRLKRKIGRLRLDNPRKKTQAEGDGVAAIEKQRKYRLSGLTFKSIGDHLTKVAHDDSFAIASWFAHANNGAYRPQPFEQMAAVLKSHGHEGAYREIAITKRVLHRSAGNMNWGQKWLEFILLDLPVGYGYKPWRAVVWALLIWLLAGGAYCLGRNAMVPADSTALIEANRAKERSVASIPANKRAEASARPLRCFVPHGYPEFKPWVYAADLFLPVIELGQKHCWVPDPPQPPRTRVGLIRWLVYNLPWVLPIAGWYLTTLFITSFTPLLRTD